jgi:hypothetical protein
MSRLFFHSSKASEAAWARFVGVMMAAATLTLGGCAEGRMAIPGNADRIASGSGQKITAVATTRPGRLYVLDRDDDSILWAGDVRAGEALVIDGVARKVTLDGKTVAQGVVREHHYVAFLSQN